VLRKEKVGLKGNLRVVAVVADVVAGDVVVNVDVVVVSEDAVDVADVVH